VKILRIALALLVTLAMLYIARNNSRGRPEHIVHTDGEFTFTITTVPKITEHKTDRLALKVDGPPYFGYRVRYRSSQPGNIAPERPADFAAIDMRSENPDGGEYFVDVTAGAKGGQAHYYFDIVDAEGVPLAQFMKDDGAPFRLRFIGEVPPFILVAHIALMFVTVFCISLGAVLALRAGVNTAAARPVLVCLFWAAVAGFLGGYPFGFAMNHYAFSTIWEGIPFGTDATDNKTQLLLLSLLFAVLAGIGTLTRGKIGRDLFSPRVLARFGLIAFAVMLFIYIIPHSIQYSPAFIYLFCGAWTAGLVVIYLVAWQRSRRSAA